MRIIVSLTGLAIVAVFAFQNCNIPPKAGEVAAEGSQKAQATRIDMVAADISKVSFYMKEAQTMTRSGKSFSVMMRKQLSFDMATGVLTETFEDTKTSRTFCPPDTMKNELGAMLEDSQVCKWGHVSDPGEMCSMALILPYAEVTTGQEMWALGSATDGCGNNAIDLCDSRGDVLKQWAADMNQTYSNYTCK
ncbi:MAG: hypothetical protein K0R29_193 [Pseudobdellovibrio sp.]|nr:hypothetical protein [Pseudobdellovibrio sp.]